MPKHIFIRLFILLLMPLSLQAQQAKWLRNEGFNEHKAVETYLNPVYHEAQHLPDSMKLQVGDAGSVQKIIDGSLHSRVYAVEIITIYSPDMTAIFDKLFQLPNLQYITISGHQRASSDNKPYQLPGNITRLQGLKGIELAFTDNLDMADAFKKLIPLKKLNSLAITGYYHPIPNELTYLKQIEEIRINTLNIRDMNLAEAPWKTVYLLQGQQTAINKRFVDNGDDQKALLNLAKVKSLRMLDIGLFNLTDASILKNLGQLTGLKLYATKQLNNLTSSIAALNNLESLSIYNFDDKVQISIADIGRLSKLKNLSITLNTYGDIKTPSSQLEALRNLKNLESLNLDYSGIGSMPDIFGGMVHLKRLSLSINGLPQLPESIYDLPELEYLDLSSNPLGSLPDRRTYGWPKLKTLLLNHTKLTKLPTAIVHLPALENLSATNNRISILPKGWQNLKNLKTLNLADNKLTVFNYGILDNPSIQRLEIQNNNIAIMADVTRDNNSLRYLNLSNNLLTNLPANIGKLHSLETLQGYNLKLKGLPASLGNCLKLIELSLPGSIAASTVLPAGLKNAADLQLLNLSGCPLIDHESIFEVLLTTRNKPLNADLSGNNISSLPATDKWANANFGLLNLLGNKFNKIPIELAGANFSVGLFLYRNQLDFDHGTAGDLFKTPGDFKVLFEETGINYPKSVNDSVYALALTNRIRARAKAGNWQGAISYAEKAKQLAPTVYQRNAPWNMIGVSRFNLKDYTGAIANFDKYIEVQNTPGLSVRYDTSTELEYKLKADSALNNPVGMANTYIQTGSMKNFIKALSLAKRINDKGLYQQLAGKVLAMTRYNIEWHGKTDHYSPHEHYMSIKGQYPDDILIRHAILLLITGNARQAIDTLKLSNKNYRPGDYYYPYKQLLLAAANYIVKPSAFGQLKTALTDSIAKTTPVLKDEFTFLPFAEWLPASNYNLTQQKDLNSIYNIALTPLPVKKVDLTKTDSNDSKANRIALLSKRLDNVRNGAMNDIKEWQTVVDLADEMIGIDSVTYKRFTDWYFIGLARFKTGDYQGTINDFDRYLKQNRPDFYDNVRGAKIKVRAHLALGQILEAAQTFENLDKSHGPKTNGVQEAAVIYKGAGNNTKFNNLINTALKRSKKNLDSVTVDIDYKRGGFALDHAELLIIAGKLKDAAKLLNTYEAPYDRGNLAVKEYLLNVINVLNGETSAEAAKKRIAEFMGGQYKFNVWDFTMFNRWIKYSGISQDAQNELLALQELIDEKPKS